MSETKALGLPLLQPSQAQKHVTVNEALVRLDGLAQISLQSRSIANPPVSFVDGDCFGVPAGATGGWAGQDGKLAIASNGGWVFATPQAGWSAWITDEHVRATYVQGDWRSGMIAGAPSGAASLFETIEADHSLTEGGSQLVGLDLPATSMIFACSARVVEEITGTATSWTLDLDDGTVTFGTGMGLAAGSYCTGLLSQPTAIYAGKSVRISPDGGEFSGGRLRLAAHVYRIDLPV